MATLLNFDVTS